jgi:hypothetical protein
VVKKVIGAPQWNLIFGKSAKRSQRNSLRIPQGRRGSEAQGETAQSRKLKAGRPGSWEAVSRILDTRCSMLDKEKITLSFQL